MPTSKKPQRKNHGGIGNLPKSRRLALTRNAGIASARAAGYRPRTDFARARAKAGLTLSELAKKLGVTKQYLHDVERGRRPVPTWMQPAVDKLLELLAA